MRRIWALAYNTYREAVRDRVLYSILFFAIAVIALSLALQEVTVGDRDKVVRSVAQGSIAAFGSIIAMFLGISLVWKEVERKTVYTILSKPISRWMFVLGKYLGMMMTLTVQVLVMFVVYTLLLTFQQSFPPTVVYVSALLLIVELMLLTSWATLFSTYSAPTTAAGFTLAIFVIGHLADDIWLYGSKLDNASAQSVAKGLYWILPNFEIFNIRDHAVHELPIPWEQVAGAIGYGLTYTVAVLGLAMFVFERRDLK
jgi:ABC-type transport system involved in multi-copper enzyme maturation permease subunit